MVRTAANPASVRAAETSAIFRFTPPTLTPRSNTAYLVIIRLHQSDVVFGDGTPSLRRQAAGTDQRELPRGAGHDQRRRAPATVERELSLRPARFGDSGI